MLLLNKSQAQCTGAFGDVVAGTYFTIGSGFYGNPLDADRTGPYHFIEGQPDDGSYTIVKSTVGMGHVSSGAWHFVTDHGNDPNGYIMVINADYTPGIFYRETKTGLCPNTTYRFSAYVVNLLRTAGNNPMLTFSILDGSTNEVLVNYDAPEIQKTPDAPEWVERFTVFKTPPNVSSVIIQIRNNAPGGIGNDLALDDITFRPCGPEIIPSVDGLVTSDKKICVGDTRDVTFSVNVPTDFYIQTEYLWQEKDANGAWIDLMGETNAQYTKGFINAEAGNYQYRLLIAERGSINAENCRANTTFEISVIPPPVPSVVSPLITVCEGDPISLSVNNAASYKWTGPLNFAADTQSPIIDNASTDMAGTYYITIGNDAGCEASAEIKVAVIPGPNALIAPIAPICKGSSVTLNASGGNLDGGLSYRWTPVTGLSGVNTATPIARPTETTDYTVYVSNGYCETSAHITIEVIKDLKAMAGADPKIIRGNSVQLNGSIAGENIKEFFWTPSDYLDDAAKLNPIATPPVSTTYTLHVISTSGCTSSTDQVFIEVYEKLIIPNSFSPNGDGINDNWNIIAIDAYANPKIKVLNRYGQLMFESKGETKSWNGKHQNEDVPVGVYYYMIYLESGLKPLSGSLMVIR